MRDIGLTADGDLIIEKADLKTTGKDEFRYQRAFTIVMGFCGDWFSDKNLGANLEELIGMASNEGTVELGKNKITEALLEKSDYNEGEIFIKSKVDKNNISFKIYLKNLDRITAKVINLSLDLIAGININRGE